MKQTIRATEVRENDIIWVQGYRGKATNVHQYVAHEDERFGAFNMIPVARYNVHFDEDQDIARYGQYQDGTYGGNHRAFVTVER